MTEPTTADDEPRLTLAEMMAETGATYRQLDHWVRRGYLSPADALPGSGYNRRWTPRDRDLAVAIRMLSKVMIWKHVVVCAELLVDEGQHEFTIDGVMIVVPPRKEPHGNA